MAPSTRSSMLGWVAAVIAMVSPSQLSPAVIQRTSISGTDMVAPPARSSMHSCICATCMVAAWQQEYRRLEAFSMPIHSQLPDLTIPDVDFSTFVLARGRETPTKTALIDVDTGATVSYEQFIGAVESAAARLLAHGLRPGDMVAICGFNT